MNSEYCIKCGHKAEFRVSKPSFCPSCGGPFNRSSSSASKKVVEFDDEEDEDDDDSVGGFDTKKLSKAWVAEKDNFRRPTFEDLINAPCQRSERVPRPESDGGLSGMDLLKQIRQECARSKNTKEV